jgi:hypothetical protein
MTNAAVQYLLSVKRSLERSAKEIENEAVPHLSFEVAIS